MVEVTGLAVVTLSTCRPLPKLRIPSPGRCQYTVGKSTRRVTHLVQRQHMNALRFHGNLWSQGGTAMHGLCGWIGLGGERERGEGAARVAAHPDNLDKDIIAM